MGCDAALSLRLVGDPVDVVTGACIEVNWEFELPGPIPFVFRRYYNSLRHRRPLPLGLGHTHEYDRTLRFALDGLEYVSPADGSISFPPLPKDGDRTQAGGVELVRRDVQSYTVRTGDGLEADFTLTMSSRPSPLTALRKRDVAIRFSYGDRGGLSAVDLSNGQRVHVHSDDAGRISLLSLSREPGDEPRRLLELEYDGEGRLARGVDYYGNAFGFQYDSRGLLSRRTDRRGYSFSYHYDANGRCIRSLGEDGLHEVVLEYFPEEGRTVVTKSDGGVWTYFYSEGTVTRIVDPYGAAREFLRDELGRVTKEVDSNGNELEWVYSSIGGLVGIRSLFGELWPVGAEPLPPPRRRHAVPSTSLSWELGRLLDASEIRPPTAGDDLPASLPRAARLRSRLEPSRQRGEVDGKGPTSDGRRVDPLGLRLSEGRSGHQARRWHYDAGGNARQYVDHDGCVFEYSYASWDLRHTKVDPLGATTRYSYTASAQLASVTDPLGTDSRYIYDLKDRVVEVHRDGKLREEYRYDAADNLVEKLSRDRTWLLKFDIGPENLPTARHLSSGGSHRFSYDEAGRYAALATDEFVVGFEYDAFGNRVTDERDGLGVRHVFSGPRRVSTSRVLGRFSIHYERSAGGSLKIVGPTGDAQLVEHLGCGFVRRSLPNGITEVAQFDRGGRCLLRHVEGVREGTPRTVTYSYSGEGDLLELDDSANGRTRFQYDRSHRLVEAIHPDGRRDEYRHDAAGNLLKSPTLSGVVLRSGNRIAGANGSTFEYDDRDHVSVVATGGAEARFEYDSRDMLAVVRRDGERWEATYDPLRRRTAKDWHGERVEYYWDTDRLVATRNADGSVRVYLYGDCYAMVPLAFVDYPDMEADVQAGAAYYVSCDHRGTPQTVWDAEGRRVWRASIAPYGAAELDAANEICLDLRFPGHFLDEELGLHYNRFRYYDPTLGRYLQADLLGIAGSTNVYRYCNNPLKEVDVRGTCPSAADDEEGGTTTSEDEDSESLTAGQRLARDAGLPDAPEGYHWASIGGRPVLRSNPGSDKPPMFYNRETGQFQERPPASAYPRVSFTEDERKQVFEASKDEDGVVRCPCGDEVASHEADDMDMGHLPGEDYASARDEAITNGTSRSEFRESQKDLSKYRAEHPSCNRSHEYE